MAYLFPLPFGAGFRVFGPIALEAVVVAAASGPAATAAS